MARKAADEMVGEFLREAAVLVFVFGFLDLPQINTSKLGFLAGVAYAVGVVLVSALFLVFGIRIEQTRRG